MKGNHDHRPNAAPQTYRYIMSHSDGVVWGDRIGGYFYRDFPDYKLRAICLNTTEVERNNISVSTDQYNWFVESLDLSAKSDASDWGVLLLSHHPLDWPVSNGGYRFGPIINAYENGAAWTDGTVSCDFTGRNHATIIANIHGHIHNLLIDKIYVGVAGSSGQTNVYRMCTPAARVDHVNHYYEPWIESVWYNKTKDTAEDTAFCVYCIDLDACTIQAICYGAGYDRNVVYSSGDKTSFTVPLTWIIGTKLSKTDGSVEATDSTSYNATDYIAIVPNVQYTVSTATDTYNALGVVYYNASKEYVGYQADCWAQNTTVDDPEAGTAQSCVLDIPSDAAYMRLRQYETWNNQGASTEYVSLVGTKIAEGDDPSDAPVNVPISWILNMKLNKATGEVESTTEDSYNASDYIAVIPGATYTVATETDTYNAMGIVYYASDKSYIGFQADCWASNNDVENPEDGSPQSCELVIPDGAAYIRLRQFETWNVQGGSTEYVTLTYVLSNGADSTSINQLPISIDENGNVYNGVGYKANTRYSYSSKAEVEQSGIYLSGYIPVSVGSAVTIENVGLTTTGDSSRVNVVVFGADKTAWESLNVATLIDRYSATLADDGETVTQFVIADEGASFIRFNATYLGADSIVTVSDQS